MSKIVFGPSGGVGGIVFDDTPPYENACVSEIRVWSGTCVDGIQLVLSLDGENCEFVRHGGTSGHLGIMRLEDGEYVTELYGRYGSYIDSLTFRTSRGQIRRFGGQGGHSEFIYSVPPGFCIIGFWGRAGHILDAIGVHLAPLPDSD